MKDFLVCLFFLTLFCLQSFAQSTKGTVYGTVKSGGISMPGIVVYISDLSIGTDTDARGRYSLEIPVGSHTLLFTGLGFEPQSKTLTIKAGERIEWNVNIRESAIQLDEIVVTESSPVKQIRESSFNVVALETKQLHNTTLNLSQMLNKASGIKVRESGGVGSSASVTLNGFRGRNVKIFMDGVPMRGFGSAFQLNNIPVNLADRIEIYKGVVPIEFGADAMGGVINIVTNQSPNTYIDASYSYGSFNTHKSNLAINHTTKSGFSVRLNAFQNYSDNDYKVKTTVLMANGNYTREEHWVRRFNDAYHNETLIAKAGFVNRPWADQFFIGVTLGQEYAEIQNSSLLQFVYGERTRSATTVLPSVTYRKRDLLIKGMDLRLTANYNINYNENVDTASRRYNWFGEVIPKNTKGEVGVNTLSNFNNRNASATANLVYQINDQHSIALNNVISGYERKLSTDVPITDELDAIDTLRRSSFKNVLGLSYRYRINDKWNANLFGKNYYQKATGPFNASNSTSHPEYVENSEGYSTSGIGIASTYFLQPFQIKASFERAYRLPSERELFGDEVLETANSSLRAENSMNYNLGVSINKTFNRQHNLYVDLSSFYRNTKDFIRRVQEQRYGTIGNINHGRVRNVGIDTEVRYSYRRKLMIGGTLTYMDMRNKEQLRSGTGTALSGTYNDRMPNIPYFFGNADVGYIIDDLWGAGNVLSFNYTLNFVGEYYLLWESQGSANTKSTLPQQLCHDMAITYMMKNGRYNIALEALNFTDALLYDNFSLQKPGRSFNVKLRYFLIKKSAAN